MVEVKKLKKMLDDGLIDGDDYKQMKQSLVGRYNVSVQWGISFSCSRQSVKCLFYLRERSRL